MGREAVMSDGIRSDPERAMYRMPVPFGPSPGPRQRPEGGPYPPGESAARRQRVAGVRWRTDREALSELLPPRFSLADDPVVSVTVSYLEDIGWLAGHGYNILRVDVPARFSGRDGAVVGNFTPVLWESLADPIITGREELGMAKLYAEIPALIENDRAATATASWKNFEFFHLELHDLEAAPVDPPTMTAVVLNYKYVPRTQHWGEADAEYVTMSPARPLDVVSAQRGRAEFRFVRAGFKQLPTLFHIVNRLADLPVLEVLGGSLTAINGAQDGRDQQILE
jgi:acetoacetate decarboxylase